MVMQTDPHKRLIKITRLCSSLVFLISCMVLAGWIFNIELLKSPMPSYGSTKANTAICLMLTSLVLYSITRKNYSFRTRSMIRISSSLIAVVGLLTLLEYLFPVDFYIDQLFFIDNDILPGRMSPQAAFSFFLLGIIFIFYNFKEGNFKIIEGLSLVFFIISLFSFSGYLFGIEYFYKAEKFTHTALPTAVCFIIIAVGLLASQSKKGIVNLFISNSTGGSIARKLVPLVIAVPLFLGWLKLKSQNIGLFEPAFGLALFTILIILTFLFIVIWVAYRLMLSEKEKDKTELSLKLSKTTIEENRRRINNILDILLSYISMDFSKGAKISEAGDELDAIAGSLNTLGKEIQSNINHIKEKELQTQTIISNAPSGIIVMDSEGKIDIWNPQAEKIFGWKTWEVKEKLLHDIIIPERFRKQHIEGMQKFFQTGEGSILNKPLELPAIRKDNTEFDAGIIISPMKLQNQFFFIGFITDITERKRSDILLSQKNQELERAKIFQESIITNLPNMLFVKEADNLRFVRLNKAGEELLGLKEEEIIGKNDYDFFPEIQADQFVEKDKKVLSDGVLIDIPEEEIDTKINGKRILHTRKIPIKDKSGKALFLLGISEDITEQKEARQELENFAYEIENKNRLLSGLDDINQTLRGMNDLDNIANELLKKIAHYIGLISGTFYIAEKKFFRRVGIYEYDRQGKDFFEWSEGIIGEASAKKKIIIINNTPTVHEIEKQKEGKKIGKQIIAVPLVYSGTVEGVIELSSAHLFSPDQLEYLRLVSEPIAISLKALKSLIRKQELLEETQKQAEELQAQQEELKEFNEKLAKKNELLEESETELRQQQENLQQSNEELEETANMLEEQKEMLEKARLEIEKKVNELSIASQYKSDFLSTVSHELRTPLNSILILAQLLSENKFKHLTEKEFEYARNIKDSGSELLSLINDILDLSKVEAGKMEVLIEEVRLSAIVNSIEKMFNDLAISKEINFNIEMEDPLLPDSIRTDHQRLEQILRNLLSNAFKFTQKRGSVTLKIKTLSEDYTKKHSFPLSSSNFISFIVEDTGIGIPKEKQNLVFEAFRQADSSTKRKFGGTGLGLSISRDLAFLLYGEIKLESEENKGSRFILNLPITPPETGKGQINKISKNSLVEAKNIEEPLADDRKIIRSNDKVVLIIEDDSAFAKIVYDFIKSRNYKGLVALNGISGMALARAFTPDAIILDMKLPDMKGEDILIELKNDAKLRSIPVQIISGYDKKKEGLKLGAFDFLMKPVSTEVLNNLFDRIEALGGNRKNVLIVEDDPKQGKALSELLESREKIKCFIARDANETKVLLNKQEFDCIILDLGLPGVTGTVLLKEIRKDKKHEKLPVIIYTGKDLNKEEIKELRSLTNTIVLKTENSYERLLDEMLLFLHKVDKQLPAGKQKNANENISGDTLLKGKKILVVDDDIRNVFALTNALEDEEMKYVVAENGKEAIELLMKNPDVDLILMDLMMPEMDGFEATTEIKKMHQYKDLPIIALTAKTMKGIKEKCLESGFSDFIAKPVDISKLFSLMRIWLFKQ